MKFIVTCKDYCDADVVYSAKLIGKLPYGYRVDRNGDQRDIYFGDIEVISMEYEDYYAPTLA